tara:strand:+ start:200 stop:619 length:420 start_codon:yes stop_codon:yes gene_type:complete
VDRIKRISNEVLNEYSERFGTDFSINKQLLNEISIVRSKGLKNKIAGYITKILQRQAKFEERKQMIIDNEKKSQERQKSRSKKSEVEVIQKPTVESELEKQPEMESEEKSTTEPQVKSESVLSDDKTVAEEIVDETTSQ